MAVDITEYCRELGIKNVAFMTREGIAFKRYYDAFATAHGDTPDAPAMGKLEIYGQRLPVWRAAGRNGTAEPLSADLDGLNVNKAAHTDWL